VCTGIVVHCEQTMFPCYEFPVPEQTVSFPRVALQASDP